MKKKINGIILIFTVLSMTIPTLADKTDNLDLSTALKIAIEQNYDLQLTQLNLEKAKLEYQKKKANNLLTQSRYSTLEAEYSLASAENTYHNTIYNLVNSTISKYNTIWLAEVELEIKEKQVELEKKKLEKAKAQYDIGDIGGIDLLEQENSYQDAKLSLEKVKDDYRQSRREFRITLRLEQNELVLEQLTYPESWEITEEDAIKTALDNSRELKLREAKINLTKIDLERAELSSSQLDLGIKKVTLKLAELEKENSSEEITTSTQKTYYQFKQTIKNMELEQEQLSEAEEKYRMTQKQYELGLVTSTDLLQYEINMLQAKHQYLAAIANYYLKEQSLRQSMNLATGVFVDGNTLEK